MHRKHALVGVIALVFVIAIVSLATSADRPRLKGSKSGAPSRIAIPTNLPPLDKLPQEAFLKGSIEVLQFDDGSCESGLGGGVTVTAFHEFEVPTDHCALDDLRIIRVTARMNTGFAFTGVVGQAGPTPPPAGAGTIANIGPPISPFGPCPSVFSGVSARAVSPPAAIAGTANFFFGLLNTGFIGRDTNGTPAGRMWLNCAACSMTQYSPAAISGLGLGGNYMLRVTVEKLTCFPVFEGACCIEPPGTDPECIVTCADDCESGGGTFFGEGSDCMDLGPDECGVLFVDIASMSATAVKGGVAIRWETAQEVDAVGFRVLRNDIGASREKKMVEVGFVLSRGNALTGGDYEVVDASRAALTASVYWIEDYDVRGRTQMHGPIFVERGSGSASRH